MSTAIGTALDYSHPDLMWKNPPREIGGDAKGLVFEVGHGGGRRRFRVYAQHASSRGRSIYGGHEWQCTRAYLYKGIFKGWRVDNVCGYSPGTADNPPTPGMRCHQCHKLRAEWIELDSPLLVHDYIYGPKWISRPAPEYGGHNFQARGLISKVV